MIVAKTPADKVMRSVMDFVHEKTTKPVVACFLGLDPPKTKDKRLRYAKTLHSAVYNATVAAGGATAKQFEAKISMSRNEIAGLAKRLSSNLLRSQKYVRGLYSGGTLAHETLLVFRELIGEACSNTPLSSKFELKDPNKSKENSIVDLGDEFFTSGRAHPMIDPTLRRLRLLQEGQDPSVAIIMLDIVLGYGSSSDPGGALVDAIEESKRNAKKKGRDLVVMAHVCGTEGDPQSLKDQSAKLSKAGVVLFPSNAQMAVTAALVVGGQKATTSLRKEWEVLLND
jgi:FdrA protein